MESSSTFILIVVLVLALFGVFAFLSYLAAKKRREAFQAYAATKGWTWTERDDQWIEAFDGAPFGLGHDRRAENVLTGAFESRTFAAFDYSYRTTETSTDSDGHTTTHEETHNFSVAAVDVGVVCPNLHVSPEGFFGRAIGKLTNHDIQLESEEFNRAFTVHCEDRKFASDVLHPRLMEALLTFRDIEWRFDRSWIVTVSSGGHNPAEVDRALTSISSVVDAIPDFVWEDHGGKPGAPVQGS